MAKRIKHSSELPAWFSLKKYADVDELNAAGWYEQLTVRSDCRQHMPFNIEETLTLIRNNPIADVTSSPHLQMSLYSSALSELKSKKPYFSFGVRPLTAREFIITDHNLISEKRKYMWQWWKLFRKNIIKSLKSKYSFQPWLNEPIDNISNITPKIHRIASVDFNLPDTVLVEHFKQYLVTQRAEINVQPTAKRYRQLDFKHWQRLGILPYLDLKLWEQETGIEIPNRVMADAIYPPGEGGEETVRKTTAPVAESLITKQFLMQLAAQAALEIAEENNS